MICESATIASFLFAGNSALVGVGSDYWRIDEISPYETTTGWVWTFTTGAGVAR